MHFFKKYPESPILLLFCLIAITTLVIGLTTNLVLTWQHYVGFSMLLLTTFLYFKVNRRFMETLLVVGLLNFINLNTYSLTVGFQFSIAEGKMEPIGIQPLFLLAGIAYLVINRKWIFAKKILSEEQVQDRNKAQITYWKERYSNKSKSELRYILENKENFDPLAVEAVEALLNEK